MRITSFFFPHVKLYISFFGWAVQRNSTLHIPLYSLQSSLVEVGTDPTNSHRFSSGEPVSNNQQLMVVLKKEIYYYSRVGKKINSYYFPKGL
jgi:hypothetical protein